MWGPSWINYGDVPTWGATIGAAAAAWATLRTLGIERERDRAVEDEKKREQAEKVSTWIEIESTVQKTSVGAIHRRKLLLKCANVGDQPVMGVEVQIKSHLRDEATPFPWLQGVLPPGATIGAIATPETIALIRGAAPGDESEVYLEALEWKASIAFTDCAGRRWRRDFEGVLIAVTDTSKGTIP